MDAAASNGGLLYHGVQEGKLCVVHCINTALQGPFFSEFDLAALACDLDQRECLVMLESSQSPSAANAASGDFLAEGSHNVSLGGDFSIQISPGIPVGDSRLEVPVYTLIRWRLEGSSLGRKENCLDSALFQSFEGMLIVEIR
ncbi:hypothetical protein GQ55_6G183900 [Panicum hallii var. hallii]|uniref:ubiquitinyl hydrolase 1 n=1 Tax=Panicum hallii var. hallii TaxID=1504633 RepID=A0A2T7D755_9POAL|nr:hypothetical protein GQ55_6G183900 [Panicum hallii var. hallii]